MVYDSGVYEEGKSKPSPWMFRTSMQDNYQVETILAYAKNKGWDAIGIMHDTSGYGTASKDTAEKLIPAAGFKILATETYNIGDTDMTSQLQKMQQAGVKQIINFGLGPEDANLLRSAQKINYKVQWSGAWGFSDPVVVDLAGKDLAEGVVTVASFAIDASPAAAEFHQKMLTTTRRTRSRSRPPRPTTRRRSCSWRSQVRPGPEEAPRRHRAGRRLQGRDRRRRPSRTAPPATTRSKARTCSRRVYKNGQLVRAD